MPSLSLNRLREFGKSQRMRRKRFQNICNGPHYSLPIEIIAVTFKIKLSDQSSSG